MSGQNRHTLERLTRSRSQSPHPSASKGALTRALAYIKRSSSARGGTRTQLSQSDSQTTLNLHAGLAPELRAVEAHSDSRRLNEYTAQGDGASASVAAETQKLALSLSTSAHGIPGHLSVNLKGVHSAEPSVSIAFGPGPLPRIYYENWPNDHESADLLSPDYLLVGYPRRSPSVSRIGPRSPEFEREVLEAVPARRRWQIVIKLIILLKRVIRAFGYSTNKDKVKMLQEYEELVPSISHTMPDKATTAASYPSPSIQHTGTSVYPSQPVLHTEVARLRWNKAIREIIIIRRVIAAMPNANAALHATDAQDDKLEESLSMGNSQLHQSSHDSTGAVVPPTMASVHADKELSAMRDWNTKTHGVSQYSLTAGLPPHASEGVTRSPRVWDTLHEKPRREDVPEIVISEYIEAPQLLAPDNPQLSPCTAKPSDDLNAASIEPSEDHVALVPTSTPADVKTENTYIAFIFERASTTSPGLFADHHSTFEEYRSLKPDTLFQDFAGYCALRVAQEESFGENKFVDVILRQMQEVHEKREAPWYNFDSTRLTDSLRMLLKFSQLTGAIPSSLYVEDVSYFTTGDGRKDVAQAMGSFADVYRGTLAGKSVALKRLRICIGSNEDTPSPERFFKNLCRESLMWRQLQHSSILPFIGLDKNSFPGTFCMVSPWMNNGDLARYMRHHTSIDNQRKARWVEQIAAGLAYLHHEAYIMHGDLRCANILLNDQLDAHICDFGLSLLEGAGLATMGMSAFREGAQRWMAPEVLKNGICTPKGDVYSFGCVCLEIVYGTHPLDGVVDRGILSAVVLQRQRPVWPDSAEQFRRELGKVVRLCWEWFPESRPGMHQLQQHIMTISNKSDIVYHGEGSSAEYGRK